MNSLDRAPKGRDGERSWKMKTAIQTKSAMTKQEVASQKLEKPFPGEKEKQSKSSKTKRITSMEPGQRHIMKFLHIKSLKLDEIATELFDTYGLDAYAPPSRKFLLR
jgi:hypothetical protein